VIGQACSAEAATGATAGKTTAGTGATTAGTGATTAGTGATTGKTAVVAGPDCSGNHKLDDRARQWRSGRPGLARRVKVSW
jgi:hypothetical protein